jgi:hypothetical protein
MATPTCPKCNGIIFEVNDAYPQKSNVKLFFVNCIVCGCIVSTIPYPLRKP